MYGVVFSSTGPSRLFNLARTFAQRFVHRLPLCLDFSFIACGSDVFSELRTLFIVIMIRRDDVHNGRLNYSLLLPSLAWRVHITYSSLEHASAFIVNRDFVLTSERHILLQGWCLGTSGTFGGVIKPLITASLCFRSWRALQPRICALEDVQNCWRLWASAL